MQLIYAVPAAMGLGALHSLEPGHGKGIISAYLISTRGKTTDAVLLGFITAAAHTVSILLLAFVAASSIQAFVPDDLFLTIELGSGLVVMFIGVRMTYQKLHPPVVVVRTIGHDHSETCGHHHHGHHHHGQGHEVPGSRWQLFSVGFFSGLIPCPSALAILLSAIGVHHVAIGMGLVAAFSTGMAITMCTIGVLVVQAEDSIHHLERWRVVEVLTTVSAIIVLLLGVFIVIESLYHLGYGTTIYGSVLVQ